MLDNKNLKTNLNHVPYETKVLIYDKNCAGCAFALIRTELRGVKTVHQNLQSAIDECVFHDDAVLLRGCQFGGDEYSLNEIIMNTCRFWNDKAIEGGDNEPVDCFVVIEDINELKEIKVGQQ